MGVRGRRARLQNPTLASPVMASGLLQSGGGPGGVHVKRSIDILAMKTRGVAQPLLSTACLQRNTCPLLSDCEREGIPLTAFVHAPPFIVVPRGG